MDPNNALISVNPPLVVPRTWTPTEVATSPENLSNYTLTSPFRFSPDSDNLSPAGFTYWNHAIHLLRKRMQKEMMLSIVL